VTGLFSNTCILIEQMAVSPARPRPSSAASPTTTAPPVPHHPSTLGNPLTNVDQLDLVRIDDVNLGCAAVKRRYRLATPLGLRQVGGQAHHGWQPGSLAKSLVSVTGAVAPSPGNSIRVLHDSSGVSTSSWSEAAAPAWSSALAAAHQGLSTIVIEKLRTTGLNGAFRWRCLDSQQRGPQT